MKMKQWTKPEGKTKGSPFLFIAHVPSSTVLELHGPSQAEISMYGECTKPWDLLQGSPPPFGLFIFSSKSLLLSYVFSMENIDKQVLPSAKTLHRKMAMSYKMRKLRSNC